MTEKEILERQEESGNRTFYLVKVGVFFVAYGHGAFALNRATGYAVKRRHRKSGDVLQSGFPVGVIGDVCRKLTDMGALVEKENDNTWRFSGIDGTPDAAVVEEPLSVQSTSPGKPSPDHSRLMLTIIDSMTEMLATLRTLVEQFSLVK